jgi:flagellar hook-basal body complex protein FliE
MPVDSIASVGSFQPLPPLQPLVAPPQTTDAQSSVPVPFASALSGLLASNTAAYANADAAIRDLATGEAQDLHTVSLAVAQADISFRLILELRNRLADAYQEVTRMQV